MTPLVSFTDVTLGYGSRSILSGISLDIPRGDFLGLVGPNGSGKTTVLRGLLGTLPAMQGTIAIGPDVRFGYVPQREQIDARYPLTVLDVVLMGRYPRLGLVRRPGSADRSAAERALDQVGIGNLSTKRLADLSGGQKQRALIARALVGDPTVLVLDEPTNGLDLVASTQILGLVRDLHEREGLTVLMVSHALNEVANYVSRIALLVEGGLRIGPVGEVLTEGALSDLYRIPVEVASFEGHRIVLARHHRGANHA